MRSPARTGAVLALSVAVIAGCTSEEPASETVTVEPTADSEVDAPDFTPGEDESPDPDPGHDAATNALTTAADELGGLAFDLSREDEDGEELWEVSVAVGDEQVDVLVSTDGASILEERDREALDDEDRRLLDAASVAATEAAVIAAQDLGGTVEEVELDEDGDVVVWEVTLRTTDGAETEATIDAVTGEVR